MESMTPCCATSEFRPLMVLDEDEGHGLLVVREARALHPVTQILILSGFSSLDNIGDILNRPELDIYGTLTPVPMIGNTPKNYGLCIKELASIASKRRAGRDQGRMRACSGGYRYAGAEGLRSS